MIGVRGGEGGGTNLVFIQIGGLNFIPKPI